MVQKLRCFISDLSFLCGSLEERLSIMRRGFYILREENIRLRSELSVYKSEVRRLSNVMFNFAFD